MVVQNNNFIFIQINIKDELMIQIDSKKWKEVYKFIKS